MPVEKDPNVDRLREAKTQEAEARHREQRTRRIDAAAIADRILDSRMDRPKYAFIEILPWLQPAEENVSSITTWEATRLIIKIDARRSGASKDGSDRRVGREVG